jgi:hypothetical protein
MLTVTDRAGARLAQLLHASGNDAVVRIERNKRRLRLHFDQLRPDDQTVLHNGRVVLALDERLSKTLASRKIEIRDTGAGPRLRLQPR